MKLTEGELMGFMHHYDENQSARRQQAIIEIQLNNVMLLGLMDTGADLSVVHPEGARKAGSFMETEDAINIGGFGGQRTNTLGRSKLKLTIGSLAYFGEFWISDFGESPPFHIILGMDFLSQAGISMDCRRREVWFPD